MAGRASSRKGSTTRRGRSTSRRAASTTKRQEEAAASSSAASSTPNQGSASSPATSTPLSLSSGSQPPSPSSCIAGPLPSPRCASCQALLPTPCPVGSAAESALATLCEGCRVKISPNISPGLCMFFLVLLYAGVCAAIRPNHILPATVACAFLSLFGFFLTYRVIPSIAMRLRIHGLCGRDLNKLPVTQAGATDNDAQQIDLQGNDILLQKIPDMATGPVSSYGKNGRPLIPEAAGLAPAVVFILISILCQLIFTKEHTKLLEYNAGLFSVCLMTFLGFADDVLNVSWRFKMGLPLVAFLPLLLAYSGSTTIVVPSILRSYLPGVILVDLGYAYHLYMAALTVFCTNSINIYAGMPFGG
eukprot:GHVT01019221.1.p1 GENE.GHVT01019221.1~~GHVT01019221.1.p1  ORF type:complete len:360 (-),score=34.71 GHVT01019221.1:1923-3002(-)